MTRGGGGAVRRADRHRGARGGRRRRSTASARSRSARPYVHSVRSQRPLGRADRAADLAPVVLRHGRAGPPGDRGGRVATAVRIVPADPWKRVLLDWMHNLRPWCISRQLWWGHRIPVWYCDACEEIYVARDDRRRAAASCDGELRQETDVLDTWFSSAAVAVRGARLAGRDAGARAPSTRPTSSRPRARSSISGSRAWS